MEKHFIVQFFGSKIWKIGKKAWMDKNQCE